MIGEEFTMQSNAGTSFSPPTLNASFHQDANEKDSWIQKMPYRMLGNTGMPLSLLSYGASALANFYR